MGSNEVESKAPAATMPQEVCAQDFELPIPSGSTGEAHVFLVDPISSSGDLALSPGSASVGNFTNRVPLEHLLGRGTLSGAYVEVVSGYCGFAPGAFDPRNRFLYDYGDGRFSEAMDYFHGDRFRSRLDQASALLPTAPLQVISNCPIADNAFYARDEDENGNPVDFVCMGKSSRFSRGSFSHDAQVTVHELQHAMTTHAYSPSEDFNRLIYDDAGSINEGISDFIALMMTEQDVPHTLDSRVFSRWGLGALLPNQARGATRCPVYDSGYPNCSHYRSDASGFDSENNHVSLSYPDGLGWPMARNQSGPGFVRSHFVANRAIEQIHQNGLIAAGVLWDAYENLKTLLGVDEAQKKMLKLVAETLPALPKPNTASDVSPVTYPILGKTLLETAALLSWSADERGALKKATDERGLTSAPQVASGWAEVGPGRILTPGVHVIDEPLENSQANGKLNRGERAAVFFDIRNTEAVTAGSLLLDIETNTTKIVFLERKFNEGYVHSGRSMVRYAKVNGTAIVSALSSANSTFHVPTGNTYFQTNPRYADPQTMTTAIYVQVPHDALAGPAEFKVRIRPANGAEVTVVFPVEIHP